MGLKKICLNCGKVFYIKPSRKETSKFCSRKCASNWRHGKPLKETCPNLYRQMQANKKGRYVPCLQCGKELYVYPSWLKEKRGKFCSQSCAMTYRNIHKNPSKRLEVKRKLSKFNKQTWNKRYGKKTADNMRKRQAEISRKAYKKRPWMLKQGKTYEETFGIEKAKEIRQKMSRANRGKNNPMYGKVAYPKPWFSEKLGHIVRSSWEEAVCLMLKEWGIDYEYEPKHYHIQIAGRKYTYTPDIKVTENLFIEVKGPLYSLQLKKMKAFVKQLDKKLIMVGADRYKTDLGEIIRVPYEEKESLKELLPC